MPIIGQADSFPDSKKLRRSFRLQSSAAFQSGMDHQFTIPKFSSMPRATSLRNIARLISYAVFCLKKKAWRFSDQTRTSPPSDFYTLPTPVGSFLHVAAPLPSLDSTL